MGEREYQTRTVLTKVRKQGKGQELQCIRKRTENIKGRELSHAKYKTPF